MTTEGLMDHHSGIRQAEPFPLLAAGQQQSAHAGCLTYAHGAHVGAHELHGVVNGKTRTDRAAGGVDVNVDILVRIFRLQEKQLCLNNVGNSIVDWNPQKYYSIHH